MIYQGRPGFLGIRIQRHEIEAKSSIQYFLVAKIGPFMGIKYTMFLWMMVSRMNLVYSYTSLPHIAHPDLFPLG